MCVQTYASAVLYLKIVSVTNLFLLNFKSISFFAPLCETVAGVWKYFFFASGAMLRHRRHNQGSDFFQVLGALLFLLLVDVQDSHGHWPAGELRGSPEVGFPEN